MRGALHGRDQLTRERARARAPAAAAVRIHNTQCTYIRSAIYGYTRANWYVYVHRRRAVAPHRYVYARSRADSRAAVGSIRSRSARRLRWSHGLVPPGNNNRTRLRVVQ